MYRTERDFHNIAVSLSDKDKGGQAAAELLGVVLRHCVRHLGENLDRSNIVGARKVKNDVMYMFAKAATWTEYYKIKQQKEEEKYSAAAIKWLHERRHHFVSASYLWGTEEEALNAGNAGALITADGPYYGPYIQPIQSMPSFGDILNNAVEQTNNAVEEAREKKVTDMVMLILRRNMKMIHEKREEAKKHLADGHQITPVAMKNTLNDQRTAIAKYRVTFSTKDHFKLVAMVMIGNGHCAYRVELKQECKNADGEATIVCPCFKDLDSGRPCKPALAVFDKISRDREYKESWSWRNKKWFHQTWHASTWVQQWTGYAMNPPNIPDELQETGLLPWRRRPAQRGRPTKARKRARAPEPPRREGPGARNPECRSCGKRGHYTKSCPKLLLDIYRK